MLFNKALQAACMSLYRKYRPQNFANLVGQDHVRITLANALKTGNVHHAYLFTGPRGTGKTSTARLMAKAINCLNLKEAEPCEECDICRDITDGRLIDLIEIDAASNRGIDEIRDLREKIQFSPTRAKSKVYIIDEVHMLTKEAFNALLKTLEEPPAHVYFILATTEVHKIPETILSRCQRFDFKRIDEKTLLTRLAYIAQTEKIEAEMPALEMIASYVQGGLRDAIGLLEQLAVDGKLTLGHVREILGISGHASIEKLYHFLKGRLVKNALEEVNALYMEGYDLSQFTKDFLEFLRKKMLASVQEEQIAETTWVLRLIDLFQQSYEQMRFVTIPQLPLEVAIVQSCFGEMMTIAEVKPLPDEKSVAKIPSENETLKIERVHKPLAEKVESKIEVETQMSDRNSAQKKSLNIDQIKTNWPRVFEHLKIPAARRIFPAATVVNLSGHTLHLTFKTHFFISKLNETANRLDFETALETVFGQPFKIASEVEKITLQNEAQQNDLNKVLEIFGGEMVEG